MSRRCGTTAGRFVQSVALLALGCLFLAAGCAVRPLASLPDEHEARRVRQRFASFALQQDACNGFMADATVRVTAMLRNGGLSGLLLARAPGSIKFAGLNPFGQPVLVLATDGENFTVVNAIEEKAWSGPVTADKVVDSLPAGLSFAELYDLVAGRLPAACRQDIEVRREPGTTGYRLVARCPGLPLERQLVFTPDSMTVSRMELIDPAANATLVFISYQEGDSGAACHLPGRIIFEETKATGVTVDLALSAVDSTLTFVPADFTQKVPAGFERIIVK